MFYTNIISTYICTFKTLYDRIILFRCTDCLKINFNILLGLQREIGNGNEYANMNTDDRVDIEEVTFTLKDREDTDQQIDENGDENVYFNVTSKLDISMYQIQIENLKKAVIDKQREEGFKKEYEVNDCINLSRFYCKKYIL